MRANNHLIRRAFVKYTLLSIVGALAATIGIIVDGLVTSNVLGAKAMAAYGLASPIILIAAAIAGIFSDGGVALGSTYLGEGDEDRLHTNFVTSCISVLLIGILLTLIFVPFATPFARLLGADDTILKMTSDYIMTLSMGFIPCMMALVLVNYARMTLNPILIGIAIVGMTSINVTLDIVFSKYLGMGMFGMGLATSISYTVPVVVAIPYFLRKNEPLSFLKPTYSFVELRKTIITGATETIMRIGYMIRAIALNSISIAVGGTIALSALSIKCNFEHFITSVELGVGMTILLFIGLYYGEKSRSYMRKSLTVAFEVGAILSVAVGIICFIFAPTIVSMFERSDKAVVNEAVNAIRFYSISLPFCVFNVSMTKYMQAIKQLVVANMIAMCETFFGIVIAALVLGNIIGINGVFMAFIVGEIITVLFTYIVLCVKCKKLIRCRDDIIFMEIEPHRAYWELTIGNSMEEVITLSRKVITFCEKEGIDEKKATTLALAIEEMAGNIVSYAFPPSKKRFIDIKILISEDNSISLNIRNDGTAFNPLSYKSDSKKKFGIQLVRNMTDHIEYSNHVGINTLTITID